MSKVNAEDISEKAKAKLRPKVQMGGPVTKNGKDVSKQIERQTARKYGTSDGYMVKRKKVNYMNQSDKNIKRLKSELAADKFRHS
jgi:hypothetical protein